MQEAKTPTPQNQPEVESAIRILTGDWGAQRYYTTIAHELKRYRQEPPQPKVDRFQSAMGLTNTTTLSLSLVPRGEAMSGKCWKASGTTVCNIETSYPHLLSGVTIYAPTEVSDAALQDLLNQILNQTDQRIKAISLTGSAN